MAPVAVGVAPVAVSVAPGLTEPSASQWTLQVTDGALSPERVQDSPKATELTQPNPPGATPRWVGCQGEPGEIEVQAPGSHQPAA